jgi:hypothetical protein
MFLLLYSQRERNLLYSREYKMFRAKIKVKAWKELRRGLRKEATQPFWRRARPLLSLANTLSGMLVPHVKLKLKTISKTRDLF